jgi:HEAT repeat protein
VNSIASIDGAERVTALLEQLEAAAGDAKQKLLIVLALGKVGDVQALPTLRKLSQRDDARSVREAATQAYAAVLGRAKSSKADAGVAADAARADAGRLPDAARP